MTHGSQSASRENWLADCVGNNNDNDDREFEAGKDADSAVLALLSHALPQRMSTDTTPTKPTTLVKLAEPSQVKSDRSDPAEFAKRHHVVIIGGGFAGLNAALALKRAPVRITLIDRRNFHCFQPLLYQVATGGLSPANICAPLRSVLRRQKNATVLMGEVVDFNLAQRQVLLSDGYVSYDTLIVAPGVSHNYFKHPEWATIAPGLKTIEDATEIRKRVLWAFEAAEKEPDWAKRKAWLTFFVVGGGPTGVELAGALGEIARTTLIGEFRHINPADAEITLAEGQDRILASFPDTLQKRAIRSLQRLGVTVRLKTLVTDITPETIRFTTGDETQTVPCNTVLWAAGVTASPLGFKLAQQMQPTGTLDRVGRIAVQPDLSLPGHPDVFVIGDLALATDGRTQQVLPGVAPVAIQQGQYLGRLLDRRLRHGLPPQNPFCYVNKGNMATIGRAAAVGDLRWLHVSGYVGWLLWLALHIMYLVTFESRVLVAIQWAWNYFTRNRAARLITGESPLTSLPPLTPANSPPPPLPTSPTPFSTSPT